jgi:hypothetical protein
MSIDHQFPYPDAHYVAAAEGWLDLGDPEQALNELEQVRPSLRTHPEVLLLRWGLHARTRDWPPCLLIAHCLTERVPADARSWVALARTFYLCGEVPKAYRVALSKVGVFPRSWLLLYDAARYACLLGKRRQAERYLRRAMAAGDKRTIKLQALADPDLEALWVNNP